MIPEKEMQNTFYRCNHQRYELIGINTRIEWQTSEMDILGLRRNGYLDEIEIKSSLKGFNHDFTKKLRFGGITPDQEDVLKHDEIKAGRWHCNYFSFLLPAEIASKCDIPDYAGLYIYQISDTGMGNIREEKKPKLLHERKLDERLKYNAAANMATKFWRQKHKLNC